MGLKARARIKKRARKAMPAAWLFAVQIGMSAALPFKLERGK